MPSLAKTLIAYPKYMSVITMLSVLLCLAGGIQASEMSTDKAGLKVTVLLYSGRPNPAYILEAKDAMDQLKDFLNKAPVIEKFEKTTVIPSILGYNGIVVDNQGNLSGFPSRLAVFKGSMEATGERKLFLVDEGGVVEKFLIDQAVKKGVIDEQAAQFIRSGKGTAQ